MKTLKTLATATVLALTTSVAMAGDTTYSFGGASNFGGDAFVNGTADFTGAIDNSGYGSNNTLLNSGGPLCGTPGCDGSDNNSFVFEGNAGQHMALEGVTLGQAPDTDVIVTNALTGGAALTFSARTPDTSTDLGIAGSFQANGAGAGRFSGGQGQVNVEEWGGGGTNLDMTVTGCIAGSIGCQNANYSGNVYAYDGVNITSNAMSTGDNNPVGSEVNGLALSGATMQFYKGH